MDSWVARGLLHRLYIGVYAWGHTRLSAKGRWMAAVLALGRGSLLSHLDAAALLDLRHIADGAIHVTIDSRAGRARRRGIVVHRSRIHDEDRTIVDGIPVTALPRTLLDLAEVVGETQLRRAYEQAERLRLLDIPAIERLLARCNGRRGVGLLRALLDYDATEAARARSELELAFLDLVRAASLPSPLVNVVVAGYEVDACWPDARLIVELDGYAFHSGSHAFERDHEKLTQLRLAGYEALTFTYRQVLDRPRWVADGVAGMLSRAA